MRLRISEVKISTQFHPVLQILLQYVVKSVSRTSVYNTLKIFYDFQAFLEWFVSLIVVIPYDLKLFSEVATTGNLTLKMSISYKIMKKIIKNECKNHNLRRKL